MNWNEIVKDVPKLSEGSHESFGPELCFMEMTAFLAGEAHSDHPQCASRVLTQYGITLNDSSQAFRDALAPVVIEMIGSANPTLEQKRVEYLVFNVAKRILPFALEGAVNQKLIDVILQADDLAKLHDAARAAANDAAYDAAYAAANDAAYAARAAANAVYAARDAAADAAAYDAAYAAANDAAYAARAAANAVYHIDISKIAAEILLEAIRLDPDKKPTEVDMSRVRVLREMAAI